MDDTEINEEIQRYLNKLRRVAVWQYKFMAPAFALITAISTYNAIAGKPFEWIAVGIYLSVTIFHYWDARRTFAKIARRKIIGEI